MCVKWQKTLTLIWSLIGLWERRLKKHLLCRRAVMNIMLQYSSVGLFSQKVLWVIQCKTNMTWWPLQCLSNMSSAFIHNFSSTSHLKSSSYPLLASCLSSCLCSVRRSPSACCWCSTVSPREWSGRVSTRALNTVLFGYPFPSFWPLTLLFDLTVCCRLNEILV